MLRGIALLLLAGCSSIPKDMAASEDPYLWLEEIESPKALDWVRARNEKSLAVLTRDPRYAGIESEVRKIVLADDRIPHPTLRGGWIYNFWQDAEHVRGLWRRCRPEEYEKEKPAWEVILDLDALAKEENENWVWHEADSLPPGHDRFLLHLSRGGKDAAVVREFDLPTRSFVKDGFSLPEAKSRVAWIDVDTILVGTDFGPGSMTDSGYPRLVKRWKRGTPLAEAKLVFEGKKGDVSAGGYTAFRPEGNRTFVHRAPSFFEEEIFLLAPDGALRKIPFPPDADFRGAFDGYGLALLRSDWKSFRAGSLVGMPLDEPAESRAELVCAPDERSSLHGVATAKGSLFVDLIENVKGRVLKISRAASGWAHEKLDFPDHGAVAVISADDFDDTALARYESFTLPASIWRCGGTLKAIRRLPERFDARDLVVEQLEAASRDGTKVPYFLIHKKGMRLDGNNPTLLYGYGGFEISMTPFYAEAFGKVWMERGGVLALANIRGGGEFGPRWHQAALKTRRQKAFDDFIGVAEDLQRRQVTSPRRLAVMGGSNGGLLVGAVFTQRPELFRAVVCQVPLLDMARYHKLLAGASWMAEYGDPEDPAMREAILKYSPYQNVKAERKYPHVFFITSTKDDRVHPGHARKMVARMLEQGHDALYFENMEGGHGAAANLEQRIKKSALEYTYLFQQLFD